MQLAISNRQAEAEIGSFRAILSNRIIDERSGDEVIPFSATPVNSITLLGLAKSSRQTIQQKKVASIQVKVTRLNHQNGLGQAAHQALTPPLPAQIALICPGKRKVQMTLKRIENTTSKRMHRVTHVDDPKQSVEE